MVLYIYVYCRVQVRGREKGDEKESRGVPGPSRTTKKACQRPGRYMTVTTWLVHFHAAILKLMPLGVHVWFQTRVFARFCLSALEKHARQNPDWKVEVWSYKLLLFLLKGPTESVQYIRIKEDETGYSYARVFQNCLDGNVEWAEVQDPYIRSKHQVHNFVRFCELVLKNCKRLRRIHLNTGFGDAPTEVRTCQLLHVICLSAPVEYFVWLFLPL